ncbi:serine O-acetyltransferase [Haloterrigena sp. H1]|uniref:serine O-acetyltransferase n=1 Tax=Haloterrigena sp. H1 TaxID=2552943 RepID=UPI00110D2CE5|nr:serine O-acetyltransferase [Haloterrigena sp. H1]TMT85095.1 serine O-acetyltransferase [Haloterrigena sp. H1]
MFRRIHEDVRAMRKRDPAAKGWLEILLSYPGLHAVWVHLLLHRLWNGGFHLTARLLSNVVRLLTGVEIHPGAELGRRVTIDHGMGVVIGETAEVGDDVHMYHGVTLGGATNEPVKRHPTVEAGAQLGANATLLGDITIGEEAAVGAGSVVTQDVEPGATVVGVPAERVD